jgi:hypothetical protein
MSYYRECTRKRGQEENILMAVKGVAEVVAIYLSRNFEIKINYKG